MSTNTLLKVEGTAWSVARDMEKVLRELKTSDEIVTACGLDYTVSAHHMKTDIDEPVAGYYAMYRDDTNKFLGPVKTDRPVVVQNAETFRALEPLMAEGTLAPLVADGYMDGKKFFGCFELNDSFKVLDDEFKHYFIVVNDHLKPDGNITVINTPVRIACLNAMSSALSRANLKFRVPAFVDESNSSAISNTILEAYNRTAKMLQKRAETMVSMKVSREDIDRILDELFPFVEETAEGTTNHDRANATVQMQREAFVTCLNEDNLSNYRGTMYQVFNALTDYATHYYRRADKGFDLEHRMTLMPGMNPEATTEMLKVSKFMTNMDKFAKAA